MNDQDKKHEKILLRLPDVLAMVPISRSNLYTRIEHGEFPAPRKIGRTSVWHRNEVLGYIASLYPEQ